ncbi:MAG: class I SAM-dependent methyltransferase [Chitinophagaceae bacterium]|nr:class I SAM-dependent methyltransferase [Chitinophagaceae bacterium]
MDKNYWEKIAPSYNEEIFDVLRNDKKGLIKSALKKYSSKNKTVIDIGCAVGKWIPVLSPLFKKVFALDLSKKNIEIARSNHASFRNVAYLNSNMSKNKKEIPRCDVALCINAILTGSLKERSLFFKSLPQSLKNDGYLILVVPSLESAMLAKMTNNQFRVDKTLLTKRTSPGKAFEKLSQLLQGNVEIDNVPTKHYLKEELHYLLKNEGFRLRDVKKIEYGWETEFTNPPRWLKDPYPWDWLVIAQKIK